jgi:hypothetical protein
MTYVILTLFALIPAIVAAVRLSAISSEFDPFIIAIWLRGVNAAFGLIIQHFGYNNILHYNLWFLGDALLLLWVFEKWNLFESKNLYRFLAVALGFTWLAETIFFSRLNGDYNSYFRIIYSFVVILMSISMINNILLKAAINPLKNSIFLICCALVLLNTITVIGEAFFAYSLIMGEEFRLYMDRIITFMDALCSLIFALIILWMPKKQAFTLQF